MGPTDCLVLADESAEPDLVAWDLVNEAEHGPDSAAILVTTSDVLAKGAARAVARIVTEAPSERRAYLERGFGTDGRCALVCASDWDSACAFADEFAPEHMLVLASPEREQRALDAVPNAGEILLGPFTPFSAANYAIGVTAVLPTNGYARSMSGVTCRDMMRSTMIAHTTRDALAALAPVIDAFADAEGLPMHARAARARLSALRAGT
jgi:histidinol dehydrogenase